MRTIAASSRNCPQRKRARRPARPEDRKRIEATSSRDSGNGLTGRIGRATPRHFANDLHVVVSGRDSSGAGDLSGHRQHGEDAQLELRVSCAGKRSQLRVPRHRAAIRRQEFARQHPERRSGGSRNGDHRWGGQHSAQPQYPTGNASARGSKAVTPHVETGPWAAILRRSAAESRGKRQFPILRILLVYTLFGVYSFPQTPIPPDWCRALPRPEYKTLKRVRVSDP